MTENNIKVDQMYTTPWIPRTPLRQQAVLSQQTYFVAMASKKSRIKSRFGLAGHFVPPRGSFGGEPGSKEHGVSITAIVNPIIRRYKQPSPTLSNVYLILL